MQMQRVEEGCSSWNGRVEGNKEREELTPNGLK